jgi:hypothetical protein
MLRAQEKVAALDEHKEAKKAWEDLIISKGGREKLESIRNMLTETESLTRLDVFPNVQWSFSYLSDRKSESGRRPVACFTDLRKDDQFFADENGINRVQHSAASSLISDFRLAYLLETKWDKPEPLRISLLKRSGKTFNVIETRFGAERMDFMFDPEDLLVTQVNSYDPTGKLVGALLLSDYTEIDGIQMPRTWAVLTNYKQSTWKKKDAKFIRINFAFNVDYDSGLFKRPLRAGSKDDWKPKKTKN